MAFDGITVSAIVDELNHHLIDGRLFKIAQPEPDALLLTIKNNKNQYKLLISAGASLPLIYLTETNKPSPLTAPGFCMLLRKHLNNGKIIRIFQPDLERIVHFEIEHFNEMGDLCRKYLIVELMGKHSNIIFCDENYKIIDSIKHINGLISSVREVLPGRDYFIPKADEKISPFCNDIELIKNNVFSKGFPLCKAMYSSITGLSPIVCEEICYNAGIDSAQPANSLNPNEQIHLINMFNHFMEPIKKHQYSPVIYYNQKEPIEFSALDLSIYADKTQKRLDSISQILELYYSEKEISTRIKQRSTDLRQIVSTNLSKNIKKYDLQLKQLRDTEKREKYKIYGELITTYGYSITDGEKELVCENYYDNNNEIRITLRTDLTVMENAKKYFEKYNKLKRTYEALNDIIIDTQNEIKHLESISTALDLAVDENDLKGIKEELIQYGYIRRKSTDKKSKFISKPLHYLYTDNSQEYHFYVGKNNYQNEEVTFKLATGNDYWFHSKSVPGSHVIVKSSNNDLPDKIFEIAGSLAAYYCKSRGLNKVEIDYIQKKHLKKVNGAAPGFVIYHTNYSMISEPLSPSELGLTII